MKHMTMKGAAVLMCYKQNCGQSNVRAAMGMPDCSKTACPSTCQCAESKCGDVINDCLADSTCSQGESCADACPCGSDSCLAGCAIKHMSMKGAAVLTCVKKNCPGQSNVTAVRAMPDCSKTACPSTCQ